MEPVSLLNIILAIVIILFLFLMIIVSVLSIQILSTTKRVLQKIEFRIDNLKVTEEEIKLKILGFIEWLLNKIKNFKREKIVKSEIQKPKGGVEDVNKEV
jgi:hypothetical protein